MTDILPTVVVLAGGSSTEELDRNEQFMVVVSMELDGECDLFEVCFSDFELPQMCQRAGRVAGILVLGFSELATMEAALEELRAQGCEAPIYLDRGYQPFDWAAGTFDYGSAADLAWLIKEMAEGRMPCEERRKETQ